MNWEITLFFHCSSIHDICPYLKQKILRFTAGRCSTAYDLARGWSPLSILLSYLLCIRLYENEFSISCG